MLYASARRANATAARMLPRMLKQLPTPLHFRASSSVPLKRVADIASPAASVEAVVTVQGWVRSVRQQKSVSFLTLNDGSTAHNLQVVWETKNGVVQAPAAGAAVATAVSTGCSVRITGKLVPSPKPAQPFELHATAIEVVGCADSQSFPLQKKVSATASPLQSRVPFHSLALVHFYPYHYSPASLYALLSLLSL